MKLHNDMDCKYTNRTDSADCGKVFPFLKNLLTLIIAISIIIYSSLNDVLCNIFTNKM